jgi:hypothetical protein
MINVLGLLVLFPFSAHAGGETQAYIVVREDRGDPTKVGARGDVVALANQRYLTLSEIHDLRELEASTHDAMLSARSSSVSVWMARPDLSYRPQDAADESAGSFVHYDFFHIQAGSESEIEAVTRELIEVDRTAGVRHRWDIFTVIAGPDLPVIVQVVRAKSKAAYEAERKAADALRGGRAHPLYARVTKRLRTLASIEGAVVQRDEYRTQARPLPGADGLVTLDYLAFDKKTHRLWVPAGNTESVDVIEAASIVRIGGFPKRAFEIKGHHGFLGPTSVTIGDGVVYVGNRADATICAIDAMTMKRGACFAIARVADGWSAAPDAVVYVPTTKEVWVTRGAPPLGIASSDRAITILDASNPRRLRSKTKCALEGSAEGYAVDDARGIFYTNIEESGDTVAIDVRSRSIVSRWRSGCDEPRGVALDKTRRMLFVACSARIVALDVEHEGRVIGELATGAGLDNIDYSEERRSVYAAASDAGILTIARVGDDGRFMEISRVTIVRSARVVVAGADGMSFVADPVGGRIIEIAPR